MKLRLFLVTLLVFSSLAHAKGRGPAVEDFVGIEIDEPDSTPPGTEGLFNFEKDITSYKVTPKAVAPAKKTAHWTSVSTGSTSSYVGLAFLLGLPALSLFLVMNRFRQKAQIESASNIEVLEKHRKERDERRAREAEIKKAS